ncbi:copper resistance protein CopC [Nocardioides sp. IC4_145]|uniref:copper resistance protein CopC n=1 Tax=Nocardioides sp. IC4_145 TaxID=2714037 RepID=UPI00140856C8|nr:copper resistance protein CopC [Nocardioides sp. IC4_145]
MPRWLAEHRQALWPLAGAVLTGAVLLGGSAPAAAHTALISIDPADGARVPHPPSTITLVFSEQMTPDLSTVAVRVNGEGAVRAELQRGSNTSTLVAKVPDSLAGAADQAQEWTVVYRVVSRDGHPVTGQSTLTVAATETSARDEPGDRPSNKPSDKPRETPSTPAGEAPAAAESSSTPTTSTGSGKESTSAPGATDSSSRSTGTPWAAVLLAGGTLAVLLVLAVLAAVRLARRKNL